MNRTWSLYRITTFATLLSFGVMLPSFLRALARTSHYVPVAGLALVAWYVAGLAFMAAWTIPSAVFGKRGSASRNTILLWTLTAWYTFSAGFLLAFYASGERGFRNAVVGDPVTLVKMLLFLGALAALTGILSLRISAQGVPVDSMPRKEADVLLAEDEDDPTVFTNTSKNLAELNRRIGA